MASNQQLGSWDSPDFVADWVGEDVMDDMLRLPRRISAALCAEAGVDVRHVLDLGSGPGAYLETLLASFPQARATWVDSSESMEEIARERLGHLGDRVTYRIGDIEAAAELALEPADVVTSSRVIHHFSPESIQRLYRNIGETLVRPGGMFFNLDHYGSPADWEQRYRRIRPQFTGPRKRDIPAHRHDYPFSPIPAHVEWLEQAGFQAPDVPWRTFYTALLAAHAPQ